MLNNSKITVIRSKSSKDFQDEVNKLLQEGWELHGEASIQTVAQQDQWGDGRLRCWTETTYVQILRSNR